MKIFTTLSVLSALMLSACGKKDAVTAPEATPCAGDDILGTYQLIGGSSTITFLPTCKAVSSDCNTTFSFPEDMSYTTTTQYVSWTILSADTSSGCYSPGDVRDCGYNLSVQPNGDTLFQNVCSSNIWYSYKKI